MLRFFFSVFAIAMIVSVPARAVMEDYPSVKLQGLDKSTARTTTFEAKVGSTITYGPLFVRIQACRKAPPIEKPESAAFIQIWEVPPETGKSEWVFSGWMFASSPALSAMDHPVYDIWVLDCSGREEPNAEAKQSETDVTTSQDDLAAPTDGDAPATATTPPADAAEDVPLDSEAAGAPDPESTMPDTPAPGPAFDPDAPYNPGVSAPDTAAPVENGSGALPVDPDAPYVPAPLPGQIGTPQTDAAPDAATDPVSSPARPSPYDPGVDYDAPYSPNRAYPSLP